MADRHKSHPQAPLYGPGGASSTGILTQLQRYEGALSIGWSQLTSVPTTISGYGITDAYTDAEVDALLLGKADVGDSYTKAEADALLADKADSATTLAGYGITDAYTETEVDDAITAVTPVRMLEVSRGTTEQALTVNTNTTVIFNQVVVDTSSAYNSTTGEYTIPVAGKYFITVTMYVHFTTTAANGIAQIEVNGASQAVGGVVNYSGLFSAGGVSILKDLAAGDVVRARVAIGGSGPNVYINGLPRMIITKMSD